MEQNIKGQRISEMLVIILYNVLPTNITFDWITIDPIDKMIHGQNLKENL